MNRRDRDVLLALCEKSYDSQRSLARQCECSLGAVNASLKNLCFEGYITEEMELTAKSKALFKAFAPRRAVILAAGFEMWISPVNRDKPRALSVVYGEPLIERLIKQLQAVNIKEIRIVVGFAKEQFEYLIDKYGVELVVNDRYAVTNNLHSMALVKEKLENCYVCPGDVRCRENPFSKRELYSWYMVSKKESPESSVRVNRKNELAVVCPPTLGNEMLGISYISAQDSQSIAQRLAVMDMDRRYSGAFWEETLYDGDKFLIGPKVVSPEDVIEIRSFEMLKELNSPNEVSLKEPAAVLKVSESEITGLTLLKQGMINRSYSFECNGKKYVLRIPYDSEGKLINRKQEAEVYSALGDCELCEKVIYINSKTGLKISEYIDNALSCASKDKKNVKRCMSALRQFHKLRLSVPHEYDIWSRIEYFEGLWENGRSVYGDYEQTKALVFSLRSFIDSIPKEKCLTHMDAVPENFLVLENGVRLIDWEYAAMQDPHMDIAMFGIYSLYNKQDMDWLINAYFPEGCNKETRLKIYCYIAAGGLLWSNWCEYEYRRGSEFGAYSLKQYRYAKEYSRIVENELKKGESNA